MESFWVAFNNGNVFKAIHLIQRADMTSPLTVYILGIFQIYVNRFRVRDDTLRSLHWCEDVHQFNLLGTLVMAIITKLDPPRRGTFSSTIKCDQTACGCMGECFGSYMGCRVQYNALEMMS